MTFHFDVAAVLDGFVEIRFFQLEADAVASRLDGGIYFRTDAEERGEHGVALVGPQADGSLDGVELQGADVLLVVGVTTGGSVQGVAVVDVHPHGRCPLLPGVNADVAVHGVVVFALLAEHHEIVGDADATHGCVFLHLLVF